jgi:glutathione S-transferase
MKLELISFALCPFVHRASIMLRHKGVPFDIRYIDLKNKPDWFLAISPRGKVPVLLVDGVALFESAAINEYLDETHPPRVMPSDPIERARTRAWIEVANDLQLAQSNVCTAPTAEKFEDAQKVLASVAARFESAIDEGFLAPDGFGLIHITIAPALHRLVLLGRRAGKRFFAQTPKFERLAERIAALPAVTSTVLEDFEARYLVYLEGKESYLARTVGGVR